MQKYGFAFSFRLRPGLLVSCRNRDGLLRLAYDFSTGIIIAVIGLPQQGLEKKRGFAIGVMGVMTAVLVPLIGWILA